MDIRMDMVVTRAAYRRPHDSLSCDHTGSTLLFTQSKLYQLSETRVDLISHQNAVLYSPIMVMVSLRRCSFSAATLMIRKVTKGVKASTK